MARFGTSSYDEVSDQMLMAAGRLISKVTGGLSAPLGDKPARGRSSPSSSKPGL